MSIVPPTAHRTAHAALGVAWLASIALLLGQIGAVSLEAALPPMGPSKEVRQALIIGRLDFLPDAAMDPFKINGANAFLVADDDGWLVLAGVSTHCGCHVAWKRDQNRFIGLCHASQYSKSGEFIQGPAPRDMDRFTLVALDAAGTVLARSRSDGVLPYSLDMPSDATLVADTGQPILGAPK